MRTQTKKLTQGFTIIEVMIVLAIAGLILAIIFLAVPALQRNSRNNSRINDAAKLAGLINDYASNHGGQLPTSYCTSGTCAATALDIRSENWAIFATPSTINTSGTANYGANDGTTMVMNTGWKCNAGALSGYASGSRSFAVAYNVETSGGVQQSCIQG
jgi:prepilin-type N-terminal cleavage/methylation domain-containing protein